MQRRPLLAVALIALGAIATHLDAQTVSPAISTWSPSEDYEAYSVRSIELRPTIRWDGDTAELKSFKAKMRSRESDLFSQAMLDSDLKLLAEHFEVVNPQIDLDPDGLNIVIYLAPKPVIRKIIFEGNSGLGTRRLKRELGVKEQSSLDRKALSDGVQKVREAYIKKGYFEAYVDVRVEPVGDGAEADIRLNINEGRSGVIREIRFVNFSDEEESKALEKLNTKTWFFLTSWATKDGTFRPDMAEHDRLQVLQVLQNAGFADARLQLKVIELTDKDGIILEFVADKGPLYTVGEISFQGNQLFSNAEIWSQFLLKSGDPFSPERLRETAQNLKDLYGMRGHIEAEINFQTSLDPTEPTYNIAFKINEGEAFHVGMVRIFGNTYTQSRVILRECLLVPGEIFDSRLLKATERRLQNIGFFKNVNVYAVKTPARGGLGEHFRDVYIEVEEAQTGTINWTAGYGNSEGVTASMELGERNFNLAGIGQLGKEGLRALRGAGEYFHVNATVGTKQSSQTLTWVNPYFVDSLWRLGIDLTRTKGDLQGNQYDTVNEGVIARASYPLNPYWATTARYRLVREYTDIETENGTMVRVQGASGTVSAASLQLALDTTNKPWDPTTGLRSELSAEVAGLGGTSNFWKFSWSNDLYMSVWPTGTFKIRLSFNFMDLYGKTENIFQVPYNERFFLGGDQTVRGYVPFSIGPQVLQGQPLGGLSSGLASAEWSIRFLENWRVFGFIDAGVVSAQAWHVPWPWRLAAGFGFQVPIMGQTPVTFGWGFPINPERRSDIQRFFVSMGATF